MSKYLLALVVSVGIISSSVWLFYHRHDLFRPDVKRDGGTELVFLVEGDPATEQVDGLCEVLRKRFDPQGRNGVEVDLDGSKRVCIRVPKGTNHDTLVDQVRRIAAQPGQVLLSELARRGEDDAAWNAARAQLTDPARAAVRALAAKEGRPPPPPLDEKGKPTFRRNGPERSMHRYRWAQMGDGASTAVHHVHFSPPGGPPPDQVQLERCLKTGEPFTSSSLGFGLMYAHQAPGAPAPTRFILLRDPTDELRVDASQIEGSDTSGTRHGLGGIVLRLSPEGSRRLSRMLDMVDGSSPIKSDGIRLVAVTIDDSVLGMIMIHGAVHRSLVLTGTLTPEQQADFQAVLRGVLPVRLWYAPIQVDTLPSR